MRNKEIEKLLSCDNCSTSYACETCDITWTDKKKIKEYIEQLENKVKELGKGQQTNSSRISRESRGGKRL